MYKILEFIKKIINNIINFLKRKKREIFNYFKLENEKKILNKIKVFFVGTFSYIGSIFSSIILKPKKEKEVDISKELKKINKNILNIEKSIENETTPVVLKMYKKEINKKINKLKNINNLKSREESKLVKDQEQLLINIKDKINDCENKLNGIDYEEKYFNNLRKQQASKNNLTKKKNKSSRIKEKKQANKNVNNISNTKKKLKKLYSNSKKGINNISTNLGKNVKKIKTKIIKGAAITSVTANKIVKNIIPKHETKIKEDNTLKIKIKDFNNLINKTYNDISIIKNDSYIENKEKELLLLKEKIEKLKEEYISLTKDENFSKLKDYYKINDIDQNHLVYHDKSIDNLIEYLDKSIKEVKENKNIDSKKNIIKPKKEELTFDKSQLDLISKSIKKDISLSKDEIIKIKQDIDNIPINYKKPTLINRLSNFFKYSINVGISLIPFGIFKNKLLATLTSGIILNNRIRSMNSLVSGDEPTFINYKNILENIRDKKMCLEKTNYVLLDTVKEIDNLKSKIELMYFDNVETEKLLINLEEMKLDLLEENIKVETMLEDINGLKKEKVKKKVA